MCQSTNCTHGDAAPAEEPAFDLDRPRLFILGHIEAGADYGIIRMPTRLIQTENLEDSIIDVANESIMLNPRLLGAGLEHTASKLSLVPLDFTYQRRALRRLYDRLEQLYKPSPYPMTHLAAMNDLIDAVRAVFTEGEYWECNTAEEFMRTVRFIIARPTDEDKAHGEPVRTKGRIFAEYIDFPINDEIVRGGQT